MKQIPCPFVYADGHKCKGHIVRIERYHTTVEWDWNPTTQTYELGVLDGGSHFHLFCGAMGDHAGAVGKSRLKYWPNELPDDIRAIVYPGGKP